MPPQLHIRLCIFTLAILSAQISNLKIICGVPCVEHSHNIYIYMCVCVCVCVCVSVCLCVGGGPIHAVHALQPSRSIVLIFPIKYTVYLFFIILSGDLRAVWHNSLKGKVIVKEKNKTYKYYVPDCHVIFNRMTYVFTHFVHVLETILIYLKRRGKWRLALKSSI
jgi:hypothetical protein